MQRASLLWESVIDRDVDRLTDLLKSTVYVILKLHPIERELVIVAYSRHVRFETWIQLLEHDSG